MTHFINFRFEIKKPKKDLHRGQNDHGQKKHMGVHISDPGHLKRKKIQNVIWFFIYLSTQWPIFIIFISKLHSQTKITANKKHMGVHISYPGNLKRKKMYKIIFFLYRHNDTFYKFSFQNYRAQKRSTSWTKWSRPIIWESTFRTQETWKGKKKYQNVRLLFFFLYWHSDPFYKFSFRNCRAKQRSTTWTKQSQPIKSIWESTFRTQETWKGQKYQNVRFFFLYRHSDLF